MVSEGVAILVHVIAERQLPEVAAVECDDDAAQETAGAIKFKAEKIKPQDLAGAAGPPDEGT